MKTYSLRKLRRRSREIVVFLACDDGYVKYMMVCLQSLIAHTSEQYTYRIHILHTDISAEKQELVMNMETSNVKICFENVNTRLERIKKNLAIRDYYSSTTYYRIFIPDMFPQYDKVLYIDSDTIVKRDIAELYQYHLADNYVAAIQDYLVKSVPVYGEYAEHVLGISRVAYFNAGVLLINSEQFRKDKIENKFIDLLNTYSFVVAQDQDYLNILCRDRILWINSKWNVQMSEPKERPEKEIALIHYNLAEKPWQEENCRYGTDFWMYAKETSYYEEIWNDLHTYSDEKREMAGKAEKHLLELAVSEINKEDNYFNQFGANAPQGLTRQEIVKKIEQFEREGRFDEDVEDDPPSRVLMPNEVDYLRTKMNNRMRTQYAYRIARWFMNTMIRKKQLIIKDIVGIENYQNLASGAVITCNHFNALDSFAMQIAYEASGQRRRKLFRVIKEGNYTSFPGFYGFLMRNCNTLPLSSNKDTMKKFMKAVDKILQKGHFVLIYPEQSMWWNYKKPKPLKKGGFTFAAKNDVPILPCFITMEDSNISGEGGFPVQEYTIHIAPPIYPDKQKNKAQNVKEMMDKNYQVWKKIYEDTYGIPLVYETEKTE